MTYTPPQPTNYYPPQQWPPPQPPKKKPTVPWYISVLAAIGLITIVVIAIEEIDKSEDSGTGSSSTYSAPVTYTAKPGDLDASTYKALTPRDYALIAKDPTKHVGERIVVFGEVSQFDSATGPNMFMANTAAEPQTGMWVTETLSAVTGKPGLFDDVVADDVVKVWATVTGDWTYDTALKVPRTVPSLQANMIEVLPN